MVNEHVTTFQRAGGMSLTWHCRGPWTARETRMRCRDVLGIYHFLWASCCSIFIGPWPINTNPMPFFKRFSGQGKYILFFLVKNVFYFLRFISEKKKKGKERKFCPFIRINACAQLRTSHEFSERSGYGMCG